MDLLAGKPLQPFTSWFVSKWLTVNTLQVCLFASFPEKPLENACLQKKPLQVARGLLESKPMQALCKFVCYQVMKHKPFTRTLC